MVDAKRKNQPRRTNPAPPKYVRTLRFSVLFQWFLTALSVRAPANVFLAISAHFVAVQVEFESKL
jgi:hypothetical protein